MIKIGKNSSIGDRVLITPSINSLVNEKGPSPTIIGDNVLVSQGSILHSCTIENNVIIDMGSIILDGCVISTNSVVVTGSVLLENTFIPPGELWAGNPAKLKRKLTEKEINAIPEKVTRVNADATKHDEYHSRTASQQYLELAKFYDWKERPELGPEHFY